VLDDVEYQDVTAESDDSNPTREPTKDDKCGYVPCPSASADQFRILKGNVLADLDASSKWREQATEDLGSWPANN